MEEIAESFAKFTEGHEAEEESGSGEDGKEVAENEGKAVEVGPVHLVCELKYRSSENPRKADGRDHDKEVKKEAFDAPCNGLQHVSGVAQTHQAWCRNLDAMDGQRAILLEMARSDGPGAPASEVSLQRMLE